MKLIRKEWNNVNGRQYLHFSYSVGAITVEAGGSFLPDAPKKASSVMLEAFLRSVLEFIY